MSAILRQATKADIPGIWDVRYSVTENALTRGRISDEDVRREIEDTGRGWVIDDNGQIIAFGIGNVQSGNIWALFVLLEAQGMRCGHRLHEVMIDWLRTQNAPTLWLTTGSQTRACNFYEHRGWQRVSVSDSGEARYELQNLIAIPAEL